MVRCEFQDARGHCYERDRVNRGRCRTSSANIRKRRGRRSCDSWSAPGQEVKAGVNFASLTPEEDEDPDTSRRLGPAASGWLWIGRSSRLLGVEFGRARIEARYTHGLRHINTDDNGEDDRSRTASSA